MSREDVDALKQVYAQWREGEVAGSDIFDPEVEVEWSITTVDGSGTTTGVKAPRDTLRHWFEGLDDARR